MNFIVVVSDTLRRDFLGCHGNDWVDTRHIDAWAAQSLVCDRAYAASFPTVPCRHDIMTGRYTLTYATWAPLPRDEVVLAELLSAAGYITMMIVDTPHILENGYYYDRGFAGWEWIRGQESDRWRTAPKEPPLPAAHDKIRNPERLLQVHLRNVAWRRYESDTFVARTMTTAMQWLERNRENKPFFLYVDTFDPHEPWDPPQWYIDKYDPGYEGEVVSYPVYGPTDYLSESELQHIRALYAGEVTLVDRWIGRLLERIEDMGLLEDTLVILTADHGFLHGEHGWMGKSHITPQWSRNISLYEEIARVPFIVRGPDVSAGRCQQYVQVPDIMPTLLDLAGVENTPPMDGVSLAPLLRGQDTTVRDVAVTSPTVIHGGLGGARATITSGRWSYICAARRAAEAEVETRAVDGLAKKQLADPGQDELYDLEADPKQQHNLISQRPDVAVELRREFVALLRRWGTDPNVVAMWE